MSLTSDSKHLALTKQLWHCLTARNSLWESQEPILDKVAVSKLFPGPEVAQIQQSQMSAEQPCPSPFILKKNYSLASQSPPDTPNRSSHLFLDKSHNFSSFLSGLLCQSSCFKCMQQALYSRDLSQEQGEEHWETFDKMPVVQIRLQRELFLQQLP